MNRILFVDDDDDQCLIMRRLFAEIGCDARITRSVREALAMLASEVFDVVITDLMMSEMNGVDFCERVIGIKPDTPVIVVTGKGTLAAAIDALRIGAFDFLTKPVDARIMSASIARAMKHKALSEEVKTLRASVVGTTGAAGTMIGESAAMKQVYDLIASVAASDASVLIRGETGTGKELVAKAIHSLSPRKGGNFVALNCAAVSPQLLESELFGHAKGAFTDAKTAELGLFLQAGGGTIFLDEIGELPLEMQPKLLRALQERTVRPVGANAEIRFDARIVAATNRDLEGDLEERSFREDLFYRINVVELALPPLRERGGDVLLLAEHFIAKYAKRKGTAGIELSAAAVEKLVAYPWPGNVRELESCAERAVALTPGVQIGVGELPENIRLFDPKKLWIQTDAVADIVTLDELERRYLARVLQLTNGNKVRAAELLGVTRRTVHRWLARARTGRSTVNDDPCSRARPRGAPPSRPPRRRGSRGSSL